MADQPLTPQASSPVDFIEAQRQRGAMLAMSASEADPDDASRAYDLSKTTGVNPALIHTDTEAFNNKVKSAITSKLVLNNDFLAEYARSHPLAPTISNDDWGQLDKVAGLINPWRGVKEPLSAGLSAAREEWAGGEGILKISPPPPLPTNESFAGRLGWSLQAGIYNPAEDLAEGLVRLGMRGASAAMAGTAGVAGEIGKELGFHSAPKTAQDVAQALQDPGFWASIPPIEGVPAGQAIGAVMRGLHERFIGPYDEKNIGALDKAGEQVAQSMNAAAPYIEQGRMPPVGIDQHIDGYYKELAKQDADWLKEVDKEIGASSTYARNPEFFAKEFVNLRHPPDMSVSFEGVKKLYGEEGGPEPGDNKLGNVYRAAEQFDHAKDFQGDLDISAADWVRLKPEVRDELRDFVRLRRGGMTAEEAKGSKVAAVEAPAEPLKEGDEAKPPTPLNTVARAAKVDEPALAPKGWDTAEPGMKFEYSVPETAAPAEFDHRGMPFRSVATFPVKDIISKLDQTHLTEGAGLLQKFFGNKISELAGDVPIHVVDRPTIQRMIPDSPESPGFYQGGKIVLRSDIVDGTQPSWIAAHVVTHEAAHAMSVEELYNFPELRQAVRNIMGEADEHMSRVNKGARDLFNYAFKNEKEFFAETISRPELRDVLKDTPISKDLANKLGLKEKTNSIWDAVRNVMKELWTRITGRVPDNSVMDAMFRIGEALEEANKILKKMSDEAEAPAEKIQGPEDRPAFKTPGTIGMSPKRMENYSKLLEKENQEKIDFSKKLAEKSEREQQTTEWKENYDKVKDEVRAEFIQRPDVAAERLLRDGMAPDGSKLRNHKLDADALTAEQKKSLPPEFYGKNGVAPDDLAPAFGFQSGDELVASLARTKAQQDLEGLTPAASFNQRLKAETERVMRQRYGDLETNVLEMAKDQVFSPTTLDRLSEEVLALAEAGGKEITLDRATLQKLARDKFNNIPLGNHSSDKYIAAAGRAGQVAEDALLEGKIAEAFKAKQEQYLSMLYGAEANKLEKIKTQFYKHVPKWQRRDLPGTEPADAVWLHQILDQIGLGKVSLQDLDRRKTLYSPYKRLRDYVEGVNEADELYNQDVNAMPVGQKLQVADFLFTENYRNEVDKMLPDEFRQVFDSLKSIDHFSRNEKKYTVKGAKEDLEEVVSGLVERLKAAVDNKPITDKVQQSKNAGRLIGTWLLNPESWMRRLDLGDTFGPFNQLIIRPITEGQYDLRTLERDFGAKWGEVGKSFTDLRKKISNPLFRENDGSLIQMTKANAYAVLSNMGNAAQRAKMVRGWKIDEDVEVGTQKIWNWLRQVGIGPDDLARAQKLGDVFNDAFKHSETTYTQINGVAPARIDLNTMQTPWGEAKEWYHPLIPDPLRHKVDLNAVDMMGESGYYRPSPAAGYSKTRTGAIYPIDLTLDAVPFKLKQILNDAAMRRQITDVSKIVYHPKFQSAFKRYYGAEYMSALDAWMKDVAGNRSWVPQNMAALDKVINGVVSNLNTSLIGVNLGTVAKHAPTAAMFSAFEVGPINFAKSMSKIIYELPGSRETWKWVMENSEEVANRMRHVEDTLIGQNQEMFHKLGWKGKLATLHDLVSWYGHYPVGITDLISAVGMFHAEYKRLGEEHPEMSHGDLLYGANTAVRRTHGSSILSNRPSLMRAGGLWKMVSPFYNFMGNAFNRNYEIGWNAKLAMQGRELPEMVGFDSKEFKAGPQHIPSIIGRVMVFGVMVSLIENMVDPLPQDQGESNAKHWAKILTRGYPSMIPVVRDVVNALYGGRDPSLGLFGTALRDVKEAIDPKTYVKNPGQVFQSVNRTIGLLSGLTMEPIGRAGRFMINVMNGDEHPQGISDWSKGLRKGTMKEHGR